jgi:hypothetical protein
VILAQFVDLTNVADAWRLETGKRVGTMRAETTDPAMIGQPQATAPAYFPRLAYSGGFKLALDRIMRLGGNRTPPYGPRQNSPRLRRKLPAHPGAIRADRVVHSMPAGLTPSTPAYEAFLTASPDDYLMG